MTMTKSDETGTRGEPTASEQALLYPWWLYDPALRRVVPQNVSPYVYRAHERMAFHPKLPYIIALKLYEAGFRSDRELMDTPDADILKCHDIGKATLAKIREIVPYAPQPIGEPPTPEVMSAASKAHARYKAIEARVRERRRAKAKSAGY